VECHPARVSPDQKRNRVAAPNNQARADAVRMAMSSMLSSKSSTKTRRNNQFAGGPESFRGRPAQPKNRKQRRK
jgi:hypothetical protein